eukprot:snap_masked-scaffold_21-processed-gene-0.22-mRNA-1 protein AED:1.00 eAED:1.00 QI:0/-1/0/0/-1/1/1/0/111
MHIEKPVQHGFVLLQTANSKLDLFRQWLQQHGFKFINYVTLVKMTKDNKLVVRSGHILRHVAEVYTLATEYSHPGLLLGQVNDVIFSTRLSETQRLVDFFLFAETILPKKQ